MTVNCNELLVLVNELSKLINENSKETILRTYINRSYYAIYHCCKQYIEVHYPEYNLDVKGTFKTGSHHSIVLAFEDLAKGNKVAKKLSIKFADFLNKRHKSDYQLSDTINYYDYKQCEQYLKTIPELLQELA